MPRALRVQRHLNLPSLDVKNVKGGRCHEVHSVCTNIVISLKMRIFNSRLLDPNQEHLTMISIVNHLEGGE